MRIEEKIAFSLYLVGTVWFFVWVIRLWLKK
jgi:hypothetical protein